MPVLLLVVALLLPAAASAAPAPAPATPSGPAAATLADCRASADPMERLALFSVRMNRLRHDDRMSVRIVLQRRGAGERRWRRVDADGFGGRLAPTTRVRRFEVRKEVRNLAPGASYRALALFTWSSPAGEILARATRRSAACRQPDVRADLRATAVVAEPAEHGLVRYRVTVRNRGRTAAGPSALVLNVDGRDLPAEAVLGVPARGEAVIEAVGPACGGGLVARVDVDGRVDETVESDNDTAFACPSDDASARRR